ncbi:MAG: htpG [Gammaproteobacteria bacterium]|jgi:molecular chaperone HtpG|nr:htpG [Gammaproteobacteria bacterium]
MSTTQAQKETLSFQAEVKQLLHLVTHSLYGNKEIFLRELISNASDAADKLRFEALNDSALYEKDPELKIWVSIDKTARTISIRDNGIGMNREEVIENLGTIAKSGTREFLSKLTGEQSKDANMIGQFGVGFYSAFVIADKVTVKTRRAGMNSDQGVLWESNGEGEYALENIDQPERGTEIILHLRKDEDEFLDDWRIRGIITKYSDHILLPILMEKPQFPTEQEEEEPESKQKEETSVYETVNQATALWALPKSKIKDEEYKALYKHISHDFEDPLLWAHNKVEGRLEYTTLLYIPSKAPFDLWNRESKHGLKLYVRRVFIMDNAQQLLPTYLRFVRGIVDSNDLPLNVSREILQNSHVIESIRSGCVKRVLGMLEELSTKDAKKYIEFWKEFGQVLKEGPGEDFANKDQVSKLLRFASTHANSAEQIVSLDEYVSRMKEGQDKIYYVTADSFNAAISSPHLEIFRKKGIEVLLLSDRVDEWLMSHLTAFEGKSLQSITRGGLDLGDLEDKKTEEVAKKVESEFESTIKQIKEVLGEKVKDVRVTDRLVDSPACLTSDENEMSINLQNMLKSTGQYFPETKPIFEVNPEHALIVRMKEESDEEQFAEWTNVLFDQAKLVQGSALDDPAAFVKRLNTLLLKVSA